MRIVFATRNFNSGMNVNVKLYAFDGTLYKEKTGTEIGNLGVYYVDFDNLHPQDSYLAIAEDTDYPWKTCRVVGGKRYVDSLGTELYDLGVE